MDLDFFSRVFNSCLTIEQLDITLAWAVSVSPDNESELKTMHYNRHFYVERVNNRVDQLIVQNSLHPDYQLDN